MADNTGKIEDLSFEQAMQQLENIAQKLEKGDAPLAEAIDWYERGARLKNHCEALLKQAQMRFDKVSFNDDGSVNLTPITDDKK